MAEERVALRDHKDSQESSPLSQPFDNNRSNSLERVAHKGKKDHLRDKKKVKNHPKEEANQANHQNQSIFQQQALIPHNLPTIQEQSEVPHENSQNAHRGPFPISLEKILKKPPYITIYNATRVCGSFGHASAFFKRPILEGTYFMGFILREDKRKEKKVAYNSAIRLGLCNYTFNPSFPIGWTESIAYRSSDGAIIYKGEVVHRCQAFSVGDHIEIILKMSSPYKHPDPTKISENSSVTFFKNGMEMFSFQELKQTFYCFALSLYNYAQVEIASKRDNGIHSSIEKDYFECLKEVIPYKDLQESNIFKI